MADAIDKTKETYQKGKDVVNKADDLKWKQRILQVMSKIQLKRQQAS